MIKRSTWVILGLFVLSLAVVIYLQRSGNLEPAAEQITPQPTTIAVFGLDTGSITRVGITSINGDTAAFIKSNDGSWSAESPTGFQPDPTTVQDALSQISNWTIQTELEIAPPLDAIGLQDPPYTLAIRMDSGQEHTMVVGSLNPAQTGYYIRMDGGSPYLISRYSVDPVLSLLDLLHITPTPPPSPEPGAGATATP